MAKLLANQSYREIIRNAARLYESMIKNQIFINYSEL